MSIVKASRSVQPDGTAELAYHDMDTDMRSNLRTGAKVANAEGRRESLGLGRRITDSGRVMSLSAQSAGFGCGVRGSYTFGEVGNERHLVER
jgi:hypothetical protein